MVNGIFLLFSVLCSIVLLLVMFYYFKSREKKLYSRLQGMLDEAVSGTFEDKHLDETPVSAIENSMWRYLCGHQLAYQDVVQQREWVQQMISDIAHQAVTSISNITLYSQLLEEWALPAEDESQGEAVEAVQAIVGQMEKLDFLIQSLMKLSRLETGIINVCPKQQGIGSVLSAVKQQFLLKASEKNIRFEVEDSAEQAVFDRKWTVEAISNIVDNAIKYTPEGGSVSVRVQPYTIFLCIQVTDSGIGIPEREQGRIFTRFYRTAEAGDEKGVGIGLYLAREIAKAQNGYMKVASEVGEGSTFSFFLKK